ncbi:hypothetical protein EI94DRAFT_1816235 [Lactarius quietus]|nr:hypothetical protein EI94DRAFT_1816235 [Lactarius quietus]
MLTTPSTLKLAYPSSVPETPSKVSVPANTPTEEGELIPQLACHTVPIEIRVNMEAHQEQEEDGQEDDAPYGFIPNDPSSHHYYPIYVPNEWYVNGKVAEPRAVLATYIKYSPDFSTVTGTQHKGASERTVPIMVGRRSCHYSTIIKAQWKTLQQESNSKFTVNEALVDLGDIHLIGEVNCYRGYSQTKEILEKLHREAQHWVNEILRELVEVERVLRFMTGLPDPSLCPTLFDLISPPNLPLFVIDADPLVTKSPSAHPDSRSNVAKFAAALTTRHRVEEPEMMLLEKVALLDHKEWTSESWSAPFMSNVLTAGAQELMGI